MPIADKKPRPRIGIITLNFNDSDDTEKCLRSLLKLSYEPKEIICIDNGSIDDSWRSIAEEFRNVFVIRSEENIGYGGGMNLGFRRALQDGCDYILCFNNDALVGDPLFLDKLMEPFVRDQKICITGAVEYDSTGLKMMHADTKMGTKYGINVSGAAFMVSSEALKSAGLFDESLFLYYEDTDLMMRMRRKGYEIVIVPEAKFSHNRCSSTSNYPEAVAYLEARNRTILFARHWSLSEFVGGVIIFHAKRMPRYILSYSEQNKQSVLMAYLRGLLRGALLLPKAKEVGTLPRFDSAKWIRVVPAEKKAKG